MPSCSTILQAWDHSAGPQVPLVCPLLLPLQVPTLLHSQSPQRHSGERKKIHPTNPILLFVPACQEGLKEWREKALVTKLGLWAKSQRGFSLGRANFILLSQWHWAGYHGNVPALTFSWHLVGPCVHVVTKPSHLWTERNRRRQKAGNNRGTLKVPRERKY